MLYKMIALSHDFWNVQQAPDSSVIFYRNSLQPSKCQKAVAVPSIFYNYVTGSTFIVRQIYVALILSNI